MKLINLIKSLTLTTLSTALLATPVFALGIITVEPQEGDIDTYSDVKITSTPEMLKLQPDGSQTVLMINKKDCQMENSIEVCSQGEMVLTTSGVDETIDVEQMFIFTNTSDRRQVIEGSKVALSPNTVLVEILTTKGTYINGIGQIDSTKLP